MWRSSSRRKLERELIGHVSALPLQPFQFGAFEGKRRVASFGFRYDYTLQRLQPAEPIPGWLAPLIEQVEAYGGPSTRIAQVLCTEYDVGVGIGWHRDKPHFDRIFGLSLGSPCKFRFRRGGRRKMAALYARGRAAFALHDVGQIPALWEHSIPAVEAPRYSITFARWLSEKPRRPPSSAPSDTEDETSGWQDEPAALIFLSMADASAVAGGSAWPRSAP